MRFVSTQPWRRTAEVCQQYLERGRQVLVEGRLRADPETGGPRLFTRDDGSPGAQFELTAELVRFLGGRGETGPDEAEESELVSEEQSLLEPELAF